jgi:ABC-type bacteriocin/lantibiotic exporter with double-glycine peptidase domain
MAKKMLKAWLYQQARKKGRDREVKIDKEQLKYLYQFIKMNKKLIYSFLFLLIIQIILEIALPLLAKYKIASLIVMLNRQEALWLIVLLITLIVIYLIITFFNIKKEKEIVIYLINKIRSNWFANFINQSDLKIANDKKASLLAKTTYHFPLLQMGISNSVINIVKYFFYLLGVLILSALISPKILIISLLSIIFNILLMLAGYFIAKKYVSQETTLYSEIIKHLVNSIYNLGFIKNQANKQSANKKLDELVELDTFFRIRRELWLMFGGKIIFALLIIVAVIAYIAELYFPRLFLSPRPEQVVAVSIVMLYLARLAYLSLKIGLFIFPAKLGIFLSVPNNYYHQNKKLINPVDQELSFISPKAKLTKNSPYWKNIELTFKSGGNYLITGERLSGKTTVALILAGEMVYNPKAWIVKIGKQRITYQNWQKDFEKPYFINNNFNRDNTLLEIITGKFKQDVKELEIEQVINLISSEESLNFLLELPQFLNTNFKNIAHSQLHVFAAQVANCLITTPQILIIDNIWLDLNYPEINNLIILLEKNLKDKIIIQLSSTDREKYSYDQRYQITNQGIIKL